MSIVYSLHDSLYLNITNRCPNRCTFCVRNLTDNLGDADTLWLSTEPDFDEMRRELISWDMRKYKEIVFCGYGEPTERIDLVIQLAEHIKKEYKKRIRLNTNGMGNLINGRDIVPSLKMFDAVSISLNAPDEETYLELTDCIFGEGCYSELLSFIENCKKYIPSVTVSVVSGTITDEQERTCLEMAERMGVKFLSR